MQTIEAPASSAGRRKHLLALLSIGGAVAAAGYALREYAPWVDYAAEAERPRRSLAIEPSLPDRMRGIIRYATLAANGHNAQAWRFVMRGNAVEIHPDYSRRLAAVDPADRELWISLGCALENVLIASRAMGYAPEVRYPGEDDFIRIQLIADAPQASSLFDAIPLRQSTRSEYDAKPITNTDLKQLEKLPLEPGIGVQIRVDPTGLSTLADYVHQAALSQYADQRFLKELIQWLRFDKKEAVAGYDGLYSVCSGNPAVPRWLGQIFVANAKPQDQAGADVKNLKSSAGAVVVSSASESKADWVRSGQVYERLALTMTSMNLKTAFLNQPVEVEAVRPQLQSALGLGEARPQLLFRFGYAKLLPRSLRRPIDEVLISN